MTHHEDIHHLATLQLDMHTTIVMSSLVMSYVIHITIVGHIVNQCKLTWMSKRPTCHMKSHVKLKGYGIQIDMREIEQPQG